MFLMFIVTGRYIINTIYYTDQSKKKVNLIIIILIGYSIFIHLARPEKIREWIESIQSQNDQIDFIKMIPNRDFIEKRFIRRKEHLR